MLVRHLAKQWLEDAGTPEGKGLLWTVLDLANCRIAVGANSPDLINALAQYFAPFVTGGAPAPAADITHISPQVSVIALQADPPRLDANLASKPPDPGKSRVKEEYLDLPDGRVIRKRLTGMMFLTAPDVHLGIGPCLANLNQVVNFINNRYIQWRLHRGAVLFHAAGVIYEGHGLALSGFSGRGKSTLALHFVSRGAQFVSNDRLMVAESPGGLLMHGVPKLPRVNPGTILNNPDLLPMLCDDDAARFDQMPPDALWNLEHKFDVPVEQLFGPDRLRLSSRMHALIVLNWSRDEAKTMVSPVDLARRRDLLPAFMKSVGLFYLHDDAAHPLRDDQESYIQFLESCPVLEVRGGVNFERAADLCLSHLETVPVE